MEYEDFWITKTRFLKAEGDREPRIYHASRQAPVKVRLPSMIERTVRMDNGEVEARSIPQPEDRFLTRAMPAAAVDNHPGKSGGKKLAAQAFGDPGASDATTPSDTTSLDDVVGGGASELEATLRAQVSGKKKRAADQ